VCANRLDGFRGQACVTVGGCSLGKVGAVILVLHPPLGVQPPPFPSTNANTTKDGLQLSIVDLPFFLLPFFLQSQRYQLFQRGREISFPSALPFPSLFDIVISQPEYPFLLNAFLLSVLARLEHFHLSKWHINWAAFIIITLDMRFRLSKSDIRIV